MPTPTLAVEGIAKTFGDLHAVRDLCFEVRSGEIFGFLGPNGAGKTTSLRIILGILAPDAGRIWFEGRDWLDRERVGYLPEERGLFEDTPVVETLAYLGSLRGMSLAEGRASALRLLERLGLADRAKEKVQALSKGNQQKVQLAAAVLHGPRLLVLDEPFSGLDPINQELFSDLMRELRDAGAAVLLSAHHLDLVERLADRFLLISRGREAVSGTLEEMREKVAGGMGESVRIRLAARPGAPLDPRQVAGLIAARAGNARTEVRQEDGALRVEVLLPPASDLGPVLAAAAERAVVRSVETRRLPLHEIYLRAVREGDEGVSPQEVSTSA